MEKIFNDLNKERVGKVLLNEPLVHHTTWKIGGPADIFIQPSSKENLQTTLEILNYSHVPFTIIGRGSNLLVKDKGIRGAVIKISDVINHCEIEDSKINVGAGYSTIRLAQETSKLGLKGLEFAGGIPGSIGGAVYMNAGAHGSDFSHLIESCEILFPNGEIQTLTKEELKMEYRKTILHQNKGIVLECKLILEKGNPDEIHKQMVEWKEKRMKTQPLQLPCAGSVFRNPLPHFAGQLIETSGLKGVAIHDAQISPLHANFIVNNGKAKAADVIQLIDLAKEKVWNQFHISLHSEVHIIGD